MEIDIKILLSVIALLFGIVVYFTKKIFDNTDSISKDVSEMKPRLEILWQDKFAPAHSPRQLNERGNEILNESGIKEILVSVLFIGSIYLRNQIFSDLGFSLTDLDQSNT